FGYRGDALAVEISSVRAVRRCCYYAKNARVALTDRLGRCFQEILGRASGTEVTRWPSKYRPYELYAVAATTQKMPGWR
ncbi:hypothetical protein, partial [Enterobacter hormaechei]|uniref:hypothetical protein n=1 Tax=Enterobacter hormaechei TaxID=158836 RepID=UPI0013FDC6AA